MKKERLIRKWIGFLIILLGLAVIAWPFTTGHFEEKKQVRLYAEATKYFEEVRSFSRSASDVEEENPISASEQAPIVTPKRINEADEAVDSYGNRRLEALQIACGQYNQSLRDDKQAGMTSLASTESFAIDTRQYGFSENYIGTLCIPRLSVKLAIYLGASSENMAKGGAILGNTSVPLKEESVNCAIAGHRGWNGASMFRDIQQIQKDDPIYIETPWDQLVYRVYDIKIVQPDDCSWCQIIPGKNIVTLMTCHPYTVNTQRYIVFAELTDEKFPQSAVELSDNGKRNEADADIAVQEITVVDADGYETITTIATGKINPTGDEYGTSWSEFMVLADSQLRILMYVISIFAVIVFVWLLRETIRYKRGRD